MPYPEIDPVLIALGPVQIRWYALAYIAGIVIGWWYLARLLSQAQWWQSRPGQLTGVQTSPPMSREQLDDAVFFVTLGIILGGRLGYVLFYEPSLLTQFVPVFGGVPVPAMFAVWTGGMSFHGGLIGVTLAGLWFTRKYELPALSVGDLFACAAPIGLFFGRIANFINAELYGRAWDGPWAMTFPSYFDRDEDAWVYAADAVPRHPSQLYEAVLEGLLLFIVLFAAVRILRVLRYPGAAIGIFLSGYGAARFFVEFFREPDPQAFTTPFFFLTRGMQLSLPMIALGVWLVWRAFRARRAGQEDASTAPQTA